MFNKTDVQDHSFALEWMHDFAAYQAALDESGRDEQGETSFSHGLMGSMCLVLEEFYNQLRVSTNGLSIRRARLI